MARRTVLAAVAAVALVASFGAACAPATSQESIVFAAGPRSPDYGEIFRVDLHGHRVNLTRTPHAVERLASDDVSHDGRWIAFTRQPPAPDYAPEALFLMHTDGRGVRRVTSASEALWGVSWAPAGDRFLADDLSDLFLGDPTGTRRIVRRVSTFGWSRDARFFTFTRSDAQSVTVVSAAGKTAWRVADGTEFDWSRGRLAVQVGPRVVVYDERGHVRFRVAGSGPAWSPDGRLLATFVDRTVSVWRGGRLVARRRLPHALEALYWPDARRVGDAALVVDVRTGRIEAAPPFTGFSSPNGRLTLASPGRFGNKLRVHVRGGKTITLAVVDACDNGDSFFAGFLRDNRSLVYSPDCTKPTPDLFTVRPDGRGLKRLSRTPLPEEYPARSHDGRSVAFSVAVPGGLHPAYASLWTMQDDGTHRRLLTHPRKGWFDLSPSWSADRRSIVFTRASRSRVGVWIVPAGGGPAHSLHLGGRGAAFWGNQLVFFGRGGIWTVDREGRHARRLRPLPCGGSFTRSHGRLAYVACDGAVVAEKRFRVPKLAVDALAWAPDGKRLVLTAGPPDGGADDLYVVDADGRNLRRLTRDLRVVGAADWR